MNKHRVSALVSVLIIGLSQGHALSPPVWPNEFPATLYKIGTETNAAPAIWTKLYYKYVQDQPEKGGYSRFDFYNHYINLNREWNAVCSIIFHPENFYVVDLKSGACNLQSHVGNLSPNWLQGATFNSTIMFRGLETEVWDLDTGPDGIIQYYAMAGTQWRNPLRSTNQIEDPGATDYFDFVVGKQNDELFKLPLTCAEGKYTRVDCPPDDLTTLDLIKRFQVTYTK